MISPIYRLAWLIAVGIIFYTSYGFSNWLTAQRTSVPEIIYQWEYGIPFLAWTIIPYWSLNLLYACAFFIAQNRDDLLHYIRQLLIAQIIAVSCFILFPLQFSWAKPEISGISAFLFTALASFDQPYNQAPSLHIILTVIVGAFYWRHLSAKWRIPLLLWFGLIAVSILTTYQHHFIDLPTGALVGYFVLWVFPYQHPSPWQKWRQTDFSRLKQMRWYLLGALLSCLPAFLGGIWLWILWISIALLLVAYAHCRGGVNVFQKQTNGKHAVPAAFLLFPYFIGVRLNIFLWLKNHNKSIEVKNGVFIGSITQANHFEAVVDLCAEYPSNHSCRHYIAVPMLDMTTPFVQDLITAVNAVERFHRQNQKVLVCCALGYGRSAAVMLAWLVVYGGCRDLAQALSQLRKVRPKVVLPAATEQAVMDTIAQLQILNKK